MFSLVHLTRPLLEIDYESTMKLGKLAKVFNVWNLSRDEISEMLNN